MRFMRIYPWIIPPAMPDYNLPPTIYSLLESIVNYGNDEKVKIKNLALEGRGEIFDFDYPLTSNINKEDFEVMILNHFLMRRIGYDTLTAFKIALNVKLNEIMPIYNKLFDSLENWDLFKDGESVLRSVNDGRTITNTNTLNNTTNSTNTSDRRYSDTPQNELQDIRDGKYITDYNYDSDTGNVSSSTTGNNTTSDTGNTQETILRSPSNKIEIYKEFIQNRNSIYSMIFKDLDVLFYGLV